MCGICNNRVADKTNSHLIPSFFASMVSSVDQSYRRGKELLYTIKEHVTTAYVGRDVLPEQIEDSFDEISDEKLIELSKSDVAKDFVFCSHCEKALSLYMESPYCSSLFHNRKIPADESYFFWISILWRISKYRVMHLDLPTHIVEGLGKRLNRYIVARDNESSLDYVLNKLPFTYRVLYCPNYCKEGSGFLFADYDKKDKIAAMMLGDVAVLFTFSTKDITGSYKFYGLEEKFKEAPLNTGAAQEERLVITKEVLDEAGKYLVEEMQQSRNEADKEKISKSWDLIRQRMFPNLPKHPHPAFYNTVLKELYAEDVKSGEKITPEYFAHCEAVALEKIYDIHI